MVEHILVSIVVLFFTKYGIYASTAFQYSFYIIYISA